MLIDRQALYIAHKLVEIGPEPVRREPDNVVQLLAFAVNKANRLKMQLNGRARGKAFNKLRPWATPGAVYGADAVTAARSRPTED